MVVRVGSLGSTDVAWIPGGRQGRQPGIPGIPGVPGMANIGHLAVPGCFLNPGQFGQEGRLGTPDSAVFAEWRLFTGIPGKHRFALLEASDGLPPGMPEDTVLASLGSASDSPLPLKQPNLARTGQNRVQKVTRKGPEKGPESDQKGSRK